MSDPNDLTDRLKAEAARLGFDMIGVAPAVAPPGFPSYLRWLEEGHAAGMAYLERQAAARSHPSALLEGVRSVVVAGFVYGRRGESTGDDPRRGKVARYARGADYHELLWRRLESLLAWLQAECHGARGRAVADTAPLLERDFARLAGLGFIGKNTMLIGKRLGSYTLLGALLTDADLTPDAPVESGHCGTCTRCLDACPTGAFDGPYQLDARRCISYWTIEHRGPLPDGAAAALDGWAFGCDVCQEVCPWNRKAPDGREPELAPRPEWTDPDLVAWLEADPEEFRRLLKGTALSRSRRAGLVRNAAHILAARRVAAAIPALERLRDDPDPTIRDAAIRSLQVLSAE
ncbi:MAG TPA: tRNA epoxyqueuosine(34) reductase QueG [Isosphaeraceae bacterium]|jgi:epoxyqueuosine reductase|nr:tRNA epoxyqueuosine(34) reductase QueG [Isosphaeraceae bacterium]